MKSAVIVRDMTDEALFAACRRRPWERRMERAGCGLGIFAGLASAGGLFRLLGASGWLLEIIAFFAMSITAGVAVSNLAGYRSRREGAELRRRYGLEDFDAEAARAQADQDAPGWQFVFQGRGLPHGDTVRVLAHLGAGTLAVRSVSPIDFSRDVPLTAKRTEITLTAADCRRLEALAEALAAEQTDPEEGMVYDGFPCTLAAVRRSPPATVRVSLNLCGVPEDSPHPAPRLIRDLLALSRQPGAGKA